MDPPGGKMAGALQTARQRARHWFWRCQGLLTGRDRRMLAAYLAQQQCRKLQVGCGDNILAGWFNTDIELNRARARLDVTRPFPYPSGIFDFVYSEHMIEHLPYKGGRAMISECLRVLKPGGVLRIATPDFKFLLELYLDARDLRRSAYIAWSGEMFLGKEAPHCALSVINNYMRDWGHRFIYDQPLLSAALEAAGFQKVKLCAIGQSDFPELTGLENERRMPEGFLALESLILEARKPDEGPALAAGSLPHY